MPSLADIYVLAPARTVPTVKAFLDHFVPDRAETAHEYWIPQNVDTPYTVLHSSAEAIAYCVGHASETQSIYWRPIGKDDPVYAMVFFTRDGHLILGLCAREHAAESYFAELRQHAGSEIGYITVKGPPPQTAAEFRLIAREASS